jgi:hypothetical protein
MLGSLLASVSQRMVRLGTMVLMLSGAGLAGYSYYLDQSAASSPAASTSLAWVKANPTLFIVIGVAGVVVGGLVNAVTARRQASRMMASMPGLAGNMGMAGQSGAMPPGGATQTRTSGTLPASPSAPPGWPQIEVVKVRCRSCSSLEAEQAAFCSRCGAALA